MKIKNKSNDYAYTNKIFTILLSLNIFLTVLTLTGYAHPLAIFMGAYLTILLTIFAPFNLKESCHFIKKNRINIINKLSHIEKSLYDLKESDFIKSASAQTAYQQKNDFNRQLDNLKTNLIDYKNDIKYLSKPRKYSLNSKLLFLMAIAILNISYFAGMYKSLNVVGINNFNEAFYFSVASFTTLGVGNDFPTMFKLNVALQALSGVILSATIIGCVLSFKEQNRSF